MPDVKDSAIQNSSLPPPSGDPKKAEKYVDQLISLLESDNLTIYHTDLARFDPSFLQDHFRIDLKDYQVEISHSKHPQSGKDSYVMLFSNLKNIPNSESEKVILAYMHLDDSQFMNFRKVYTQQADRRRRLEEERRLNAALAPIDQTLQELSTAQNLEEFKGQTQNPALNTPALS
ncbi:hypothetical protein HYS92_00610 [Candidatus Daviesbacteria bacterium]|nr:hypothetical protein [Candidatus Daviesbacteria bacterium]